MRTIIMQQKQQSIFFWYYIFRIFSSLLGNLIEIIHVPKYSRLLYLCSYSLLFFHNAANKLKIHNQKSFTFFLDIHKYLHGSLSSVRFNFKPGYKPGTKLIPLIGWNYSIQSGENISTNDSTWIYNL